MSLVILLNESLSVYNSYVIPYSSINLVTQYEQNLLTHSYIVAYSSINLVTSMESSIVKALTIPYSSINLVTQYEYDIQLVDSFDPLLNRKMLEHVKVGRRVVEYQRIREMP